MKRKTVRIAGSLLLAGMMMLLNACGSGAETALQSSASEAENAADDTREEAAVSESEQTEGVTVESAAENTESDIEPGTDTAEEESASVPESGGTVSEGTEEYRGFVLDNVLHSETEGDIHYNLYVPDSYDGSEPYAVFFTLPGYEGLYFQGVGQNLYSEEFGFLAQNYNPEMIVVAPQLSDWGETSARQTIALVEYFLSHYNIDPDQVYGEGYSGGGETMSQVMGMRPDLFTAYLQCSSQWDGAYEPVVENRTPVYLLVGESDEYYGSGPSEEAYETLHNLYLQEGLSEEEISELLVLDVKDADYFESQGMTNQHGGGNLFAADEDIMGWLFSK